MVKLLSRRIVVIPSIILITSILLVILLYSTPGNVRASSQYSHSSLPLAATKKPTTRPRTTATPVDPLPTVPPGGVRLTVEDTYTHPTGWFSLPHLKGWDVAEGGEETVAPDGESRLTRAGATFINGDVLSVIHVFVEKDPDRTATRLQDLDDYYTVSALDEAWVNYTGGWKELKRRTVNHNFVIDFELYLNNQIYLARQISRFKGDWLMVLRLVAPSNNPKLLDQLQTALSSKFTLQDESKMKPLPTSSGFNSFPTWTPAPSATLNPDAFNFDHAETYQSADKVVTLKLPKGWSHADNEGRGNYRFVLGDSFDSSAALQIFIDTPENLYPLIGVEGTPRTSKEALESVKKSALDRNESFEFANVRAAKIGEYDGYAVLVGVPAAEYGQAQNYDLLLSNVVSGKLIFVSMQGQAAIWKKSYPLMTKMLDSLKVDLNAANTKPTATPFATRIPPTITPVPTAVLDPDSLDFTTAETFQSYDKSLSLKIPVGWTRPTGSILSNSYSFSLGNELDPVASMLVIVTQPPLLYALLGIQGTPKNVKDAFVTLKDKSEARNPEYLVSEIEEVKVGQYDGYSFQTAFPATTTTVAQKSDLRIAQLPDGRVLFVSMQGQTSSWKKIYPVLKQMLDSLEIKQPETF